MIVTVRVAETIVVIVTTAVEETWTVGAAVTPTEMGMLVVRRDRAEREVLTNELMADWILSDVEAVSAALVVEVIGIFADRFGATVRFATTPETMATIAATCSADVGPATTLMTMETVAMSSAFAVSDERTFDVTAT